MPRGRDRQDPYHAKEDTIRRILSALRENPSGLRFKKLKELTKLHQDTLTVRLNELVEREIVKHPGKFYKISSHGSDDLSRRELVDQISSSGSFVVVGGWDEKVSSIYPDENVVMKSTVGYAFPAISPGVVGSLKRVLHKYWMLHLITNLASHHKVDPRCLIGEKPLANLVDELKSSLTGTKLALAFTIDQTELKERINLEYVQEIVRLAKVEDSSHIETKEPAYMKVFQEYANAQKKT
jgi:DNA-binding Lrp family transcriptional regulator